MQNINQLIPIIILGFSGLVNLVVGIFIYLFTYKLSNCSNLAAKYFSYACFGIFNWSLWLSLKIFHFYPIQSTFGVYASNVFIYLSLITVVQSLVYFAAFFHNPQPSLEKYSFLKYPYLVVTALIFLPYWGLFSYDWAASVRYDSLAYFILMVYLLGYMGLYFQLFSYRYRQVVRHPSKRHIQVILAGTSLIWFGILVWDIILPVSLGREVTVYYGPAFSLGLPFLVILAMLRYDLFKLKLPIVGLFTSLIATIFLLGVRLVVIDNGFGQDKRLGILVALLFAVLYTFLIREVYIGALKQISLDKKKKELENVLDSKNDFLKIASHQFRTPLSVIKGYLAMITSQEDAKYQLNQNTLNDLGKAYTSAQNLNEIINDVLAANDVNTGKFGINIKDTVDLQELINLIVWEKQQLLKEKHTKVEVKYRGQDFQALVDRTKLKEALNNIFDNAIYYGKGRVSITVEAKDGKDFYIHIQDNGVGISQDDAHKIWQKFERGKRSSIINPNGSGLGLYLAKEIMKKHGGDIQAHSEGRDKGSLFSLRLPRQTRVDAPSKSFGLNI